MLQRQRVVLAFLVAAGRPVEKLHLMKWLFLAGKETSLPALLPFYDFVPYDFGPFSFTVYRELDGLERDGMVMVDEKHVALAVDERRAYTVTRVIPTDARTEVARILKRYGDLDTSTLLHRVYEKYPWFAVRSKRRDIVAALPEKPVEPIAPPAVYTTGYEGKSVEAFFDRLLRGGIKRIVDVRKVAYSQKYGFSGGTLGGYATKLDIEYTPVPSLGIPSALRRDLDSQADYDALFEQYEREILPEHAADVTRVAQMQRETPSALLCFEADPARCHRTRLAEAVSRESGMPIVHL